MFEDESLLGFSAV